MRDIASDSDARNELTTPPDAEDGHASLSTGGTAVTPVSYRSGASVSSDRDLSATGVIDLDDLVEDGLQRGANLLITDRDEPNWAALVEAKGSSKVAARQNLSPLTRSMHGDATEG